MDRMNRFSALIFLLLVFFESFAQANMNAQQHRVKEKVKQMCDYIEFMANPQNSIDDRRIYKGKATKLFVANCESYIEEGVEKKGVIMEISSTFRVKPRRRLMKDYFTGLMNMRYNKVVIQSSDINQIQVSDLKKIDDNTYVCTAVFVQVFIGYKDGIPIYKDITKKSVKCYVYKEDTVEGEEYIVKLGDTKALETKKSNVI